MIARKVFPTTSYEGSRNDKYLSGQEDGAQRSKASIITSVAQYFPTKKIKDDQQTSIEQNLQPNQFTTEIVQSEIATDDYEQLYEDLQTNDYDQAYVDQQSQVNDYDQLFTDQQSEVNDYDQLLPEPDVTEVNEYSDGNQVFEDEQSHYDDQQVNDHTLSSVDQPNQVNEDPAASTNDEQVVIQQTSVTSPLIQLSTTAVYSQINKMTKSLSQYMPSINLNQSNIQMQSINNESQLSTDQQVIDESNSQQNLTTQEILYSKIGTMTKSVSQYFPTTMLPEQNPQILIQVENEEKPTRYGYYKKEALLIIKHYDLYPCTLEEMIIFDYVLKMQTYFRPMCFHWSWKPILVDEYDSHGTTPICLAVKLRRDMISYILLNNGADPNLADIPTCRTPIMYSSYYGNDDITEALIFAGADVNCVDIFNMTALMMACATKNMNLKVVKLLVDNFAKLDAQDKNGWTCLHYAVRSQSDNSVEVINYLLAHGANRKIRDNKKLTVSEYYIIFRFTYYELTIYIISRRFTLPSTLNMINVKLLL